MEYNLIEEQNENVIDDLEKQIKKESVISKKQYKESINQKRYAMSTIPSINGLNGKTKNKG